MLQDIANDDGVKEAITQCCAKVEFFDISGNNHIAAVFRDDCGIMIDLNSYYMATPPLTKDL